jgi:F-type H+-transporting ATPase subunit b
MRIRLTSAIVLGASLVALPALAAGGGQPGPIDVQGIIRHLVNLIALIALLGFALKTPIRDFLAFRRTTVKEQLDEAWDAKTSAETRYSELQGRLDNFSEEIASILTRVREDAEVERSRIMAQAERSAAQLEAAAERTVEEELRRVRSELRAEAIDLALEMAEAAIGQGVSDDDHARLATDYLSRMQEAPRS